MTTRPLRHSRVLTAIRAAPRRALAPGREPRREGRARLVRVRAGRQADQGDLHADDRDRLLGPRLHPRSVRAEGAARLGRGVQEGGRGTRPQAGAPRLTALRGASRAAGGARAVRPIRLTRGAMASMTPWHPWARSTPRLR